VLADDHDYPADHLMTPGVSDFQQASGRIELCAPGARIGDGHAHISITGWMYDRALFEGFAYDIYYHRGISVAMVEEPLGCVLLTTLKNEDLRKE
jgi:hypothetical protein